MISRSFRKRRFADPHIEQTFVLRNGRRKFRARVFFMFLGVIAFAMHGFLDILVAGEKANFFLLMRLAIACPCMLAIAMLYRARVFQRHEHVLIGLYALPPGLCILVMSQLALQPAVDLYPFGIMILLSYIAAFLSPSFRSMSLMATALVGTFWLTVPFMAISDAALIVNAFFLSVGLVAIVIGSYVLERVERQQFTYARRLKKTIATLRTSEAAALDLYHEAKQAERAKDEFLAVVSHELRTPMNAIIGFSDIISTEMMGPIEPPQYREYAFHINKSGQLLLNIINDILDISRADFAKISFETRVFEMGDALCSAMTSCSTDAIEANVSLVRAEPFLSDVMIKGDEARLVQAIMNVIGNAIKFSGRDSVVTVDMAFSTLGELVISVRDQGIGISPEDIEQIRLPFQQAEGAFARNNGGLGLGLAICTVITNAHEGELRIESELGVGTTVSIVLPPDRVVSTMKRRA